MYIINEYAEIFGQIREPNEEGNSIASRGFETSLQAWLCTPEKLNRYKLTALALAYHLDSYAEKLSTITGNPLLSNLLSEARNGTSSEADFIRWINGVKGRDNYPETSAYLKKYRKNLFCVVNDLNKLKRSGWKRHNVINPESVAEHSYSVTLLCLLFCPKNLNCGRLVNMALTHDIQEALTGDYTPFDTILPQEKDKLEYKNTEILSQLLNRPEITELFFEHKKKQTLEAKMLTDIDRVDAVLLCQYYDTHHRGQEHMLNEFLTFAQKKYQGGYGQNFVKDIYTYLQTQVNLSRKTS